MNVMKKADENKTVRRLILLLIQTCDGDDHNKTLEASRAALLNALIGMDEAQERNEIKIVNTRREKSVRTTTTEPSVPITTYKSPEHERYTSSESILEDIEATSLPLEQTTYLGRLQDTTQDYQYSTTEDLITTTEVPTTTTTQPTTTTYKPRFKLRSNNANLRANELIRHQKSLGTHSDYQSEQTPSLEHKHADARALELLRSLYSLASRWGKK
jgi:transglutaminase/protease-like cytokinesis protein 3